MKSKILLAAVTTPIARMLIKFTVVIYENRAPFYEARCLSFAMAPAPEKISHAYNTIFHDHDRILRQHGGRDTHQNIVELELKQHDLSFLSHPKIIELLKSFQPEDQSPIFFSELTFTDMHLTSLAGCPAKVGDLDLTSNSIELIDEAPIEARNINLSRNPVRGFAPGVIIERVGSLRVEFSQLMNFHAIADHVKAITCGIAISAACELDETKPFDFGTGELSNAQCQRKEDGRILMTVAPCGGILRMLDVLRPSAEYTTGAYLMFGRSWISHQHCSTLSPLSLHGDESALLPMVEEIIERAAADIHLRGANRRAKYLTTQRALQELGAGRFI